MFVNSIDNAKIAVYSNVNDIDKEVVKCKLPNTECQ